MGKFLNLFFALIAICILSQAVIAQNSEKENIAILPFSSWKGLNAITYQNQLTDKISTRIIQSHRFNVIDRENLARIFEEQGLQMSGAVDDETVIEFGKVAGVNKFVVGSFTQNSTEFHKAQYDKKGKRTSDSYYTATIHVAIKMLDVETAQYIEAAEAIGSGKGKNQRAAFSRALDRVANNVVNAFFKYFAIQAFIESIDQSNAIIDRGTSLGVKRGMNFEILDIKKSYIETAGKADIGVETERIGILRIINAEKSTAYSRLIGDFGKVETGHLIRELKEKVALEASIIKKSWGDVVINLGRDVGLKKGTIFKVIEKGEEFVDPQSGESYGSDEVQKGIICITSVQDRFARAKIIKGRYVIEKGMVLKEISRWKSGFKLGFTYTLTQMTAEANKAVWSGSLENKFTGSHNVSVDYSDKEDLNMASLFKLNLGYYDMVGNHSLEFGFGYLNINDDLNAWVFDIAFAHHFGIIPEFLYVYPGVGIGFGIANQDAESGLISTLSDGNDDNLSAVGFEWFGQIGVRLALGGLSIFGEADYMGLTFKKWSYDVKTGEEDDDGDDKTEDITLQDEYVPYPKVSFGGPNFRVGLSFTF